MADHGTVVKKMIGGTRRCSDKSTPECIGGQSIVCSLDVNNFQGSKKIGREPGVRFSGTGSSRDRLSTVARSYHLHSIQIVKLSDTTEEPSSRTP